MKLSLIMPVYNVERYLRDSLNALLAQTFKDWELICVDDGSTDSSGTILDEYATRDRRIRLVHQKNAKVHAARNRALDLAEGEWVGFVDPDDLIASHWLECAMSYAKEDVDLVRMSLMAGKVVPDGFAALDPSNVKTEDFDEVHVPRWGWTTFPSSGFIWLCFIRRERIGTLRFLPDINCKEDGIFLLELVPHLRGVVQTDFRGYFYRTVEGSLSIRRHTVLQTTAFIRAYIAIWKSQQRWAESNGVEMLVRRQLYAGAVADICDWARKRSAQDRLEEKNIRMCYLELKAAVGEGWEWPHGRERFKVPFFIWEQTGFIGSLSFAAKAFAALGNILRKLGLRNRG